MLKYRVSQTLDPEERLEDAAMAKAMHDAFAGRLNIINDGDADFGRDRLFSGDREGNLPYWQDKAFIAAAGRAVELHDAEGAEKAVARYHADGKGAFIKAIDLKLFALPVPLGTSFHDVIGDYIWSVIDRPPCIMVQPLCDIRWEVRFVSVGRKIVTSSPIAWHLTPINRLVRFFLYETPRSFRPELRKAEARAMERLAVSVARECAPENVIIDCAMIDGEASVVEFNPFSIGNFGLYACDPVAIAGAFAARTAGGE